MSTETRGGYIRQAWLVIVLGLLYGACLAAVHTGLNDRIEQNKRNKIYKRLPVVLPGGDGEVVEQLVTANDGAQYTAYHVQGSDGEFVGWVVRAQGQGFADAIDMLVGLSEDQETITGISVIAQKETPGLGDKITRSFFSDRYAKLKATPLTVVKVEPENGDEIQAITGATVSTRAVTEIVNRVVATCKEPLAGLPADAQGEK